MASHYTPSLICISLHKIKGLDSLR